MLTSFGRLKSNILKIDKNTYNKLLSYPTTLNKDNIKDIIVYQWEFEGKEVDCISVKWCHINNPQMNLELHFSIEEYNKIIGLA